ncbi:MAG: hypothetical protein ABIV25_04695 [Paracoccaceae bacterium]
MARHRRGHRSHGGGILGAFHGLVGVVAVGACIVGAWHVATDPPVVVASAPAVVVAAPSATRASAAPLGRPTARPSRPSAISQRVKPETTAECLEGIGLDPDEIAIEGTDPAEYGC